MELKIQHVFQLDIEEEGDYIFIPAGIVIVLENNRFSLHCQSSRHNVLRAALNRHSWLDLMQGLSYRNIGFRLIELTNEMAQRGWTNSASIPNILRLCYQINRRHLFFLDRYVDA